ncbi:MAG TPA: hypothetical protein VMT74_13125 [Gaiellaceae bacterium]|nr:hypothetical protein [Gaiellaceae bacterium]
MAAEDGDALRLDYAQTTDLLRGITDVRFKLLAIVPTIAGAAVAFLGRGRSAAELLAVGLLGLAATLGILLYEVRNTQLYDYALRRAKELEARLGAPSIDGRDAPGGVFSERPGRDVRVFGFALAGWSYLVAWGALRALGVGGAQKLGGIVGVVAGMLALVELLRIEPSR